VFSVLLGRVVRKPVNANPGLKVNRSINFSCVKIFFAAYVLCSFRLPKLKTKGKTKTNKKKRKEKENLTENV